MNRTKKFLAVTSIAVAALFGAVLTAAPASAAPIGSCTSGPHWESSINSGVASCNGSYWRVNVDCVNNATVYGAWGGPRTAVTRANNCAGNWFINVWTQ